MNWNIGGDFNSTFDSGTPLNRQVTYVCTEVQSPISEIILCGYKHGGFKITAKYKKTADFPHLAEAMVTEGLPLPDDNFDILLKNLTLTTSDKQCIGVFFRALIHVQSNINQLIAAASDALGVEFDNTYRRAVWLIQGDFNSTFDSGTSLNRHAIYACTEIQSPISKITLSGYQSGHIRIYVYYKNAEIHTLLTQCWTKQNLMPLVEPIGNNTFSLFINGTSKKQLILVFLYAIKQVQNNIEQAIASISKALGVQINLELNNLAFRQQLHNKYNLNQEIQFSNLMPFLTLFEQCKLREICADDATVIATKHKSKVHSDRFKQRFGNSLV